MMTTTPSYDPSCWMHIADGVPFICCVGAPDPYIPKLEQSFPESDT